MSERISFDLSVGEYTLSVDIARPEDTEPRVDISQGGIWAGSGRLRAYGVEDCDAVLCGGPDACARAYEAIDNKLRSLGLCC